MNPDGGTPADGSPPATAEQAPRPEVRLVAGRLSDVELAAIAVVVSSLSVASRLEADRRMLAEGAAPRADGWGDAVHRLPGTYAARSMAAEGAWQFSHR